MSEWNMQIVRAGFDAEGQPVAPDAATLEYCLNPPRVWESDAEGNIVLRCMGWAVSLCGEPVRARVSDAAGVRKWVKPVHSRPDVRAHYARSGLDLSEHSGFDFLLYIEHAQQDAWLRLEIFSGASASGPLDFDVTALYRSHRAQVGHDGHFTGLLDQVDSR